MSSSTPIVLSIGEWNTSAHKYLAPRVNDRGGKSITLISKQTNRNLHISTPMMSTWGPSDFFDEKTGLSDGKYTASLNFPLDPTPATDLFLSKLIEFENQLLEDAVINSEKWFGEKMSKEVCKHTYFPFIKYSKLPNSKTIDTSKPPSIRPKIPFWDNKWGIEIYDTKSKLIFPCAENPSLTPIDFIVKNSNIACVLQCGGLWTGGKGWGLTWKIIQCVVKPREVRTLQGTCHVILPPDELCQIDTQDLIEDTEPEPVKITKKPEPAPVATSVSSQKQVISTVVEDSDDDEEPPQVTIRETEPVLPPPAAAAPAQETPDIAEPSVSAPVEAPKKKVVKRKA